MENDVSMLAMLASISYLRSSRSTGGNETSEYKSRVPGSTDDQVPIQQHYVHKVACCD